MTLSIHFWILLNTFLLSPLFLNTVIDNFVFDFVWDTPQNLIIFSLFFLFFFTILLNDLFPNDVLIFVSKFYCVQMCLEGICLLCPMMCVCAHPCILANAFNQNCQLNGSMARSRREFTLNQVALLHISILVQLNHLPYFCLCFPKFSSMSFV